MVIVSLPKTSTTLTAILTRFLSASWYALVIFARPTHFTLPALAAYCPGLVAASAARLAYEESLK
jgi:hypothetical protein